MQYIYRITFNLVYKLTRYLQEGFRNLVIFLCCIVLFWTYFFSAMDVLGIKTQVIGSVIFLIIVIISINKPLVNIKWNIGVYYSMVLFGIGILLIEKVHPIGDGYVMYAIDLILLFPALYYVWGNRGDYKTLYTLLSLAIWVLGLASFIYCCFLAIEGSLGVVNGRVTGLRANANTFSRLGVILFLSSIYLIWEKWSNKLAIAIYSTGVGIGLSYVILSASRTSLISVLVCLISLTLISLKSKKREKGLEKTLKVFIMISIGATLFVMGVQLNDINEHSINRERLLKESLENIETSNAVENTEEKPNDINNAVNRIVSKRDANSYSSGRLNIWRVYSKHISFLGSEYEVLKTELGDAKVYYAHNNVIEYIFRCGYLVGSIYVVFFLLQGIKGLKLLFSKQYRRPWAFFAVAVVGLYSILAMLDIATLPFCGVFTSVYFLSIAPIVVEGRAEA